MYETFGDVGEKELIIIGVGVYGGGLGGLVGFGVVIKIVADVGRWQCR